MANNVAINHDLPTPAVLGMSLSSKHMELSYSLGLTLY